jgi:hypothetical protein
MNSDLPTINVTNKPLTQKTVDDLNKLSGILLKKQKNNMDGGAKKKGQQKKSKTRKLKKRV